jgi:DNA/RNA-binding domain of Phe-tRNA-synthetase-like protein
MAKVQFRITDEVRALGVRGAYAVMRGLANRERDPRFERYRAELVERLRSELPPDCLAADPVLKGFRDLHDAIGRSNRRFPSAAESLVSLFLRKRIVPAINLLVDIYNCVSLETRLSLGAHDLGKIDGNITLRLTDGSERFVPLGQAAPETITAGEYCYVDDGNEVLCRLEVRQVEKTKVNIATTDCFYIIQGNRNTSAAVLRVALERLVALTAEYCGGTRETTWIEAD